MVNLLYRINMTNPPMAERSAVLGGPLSMLQIDGNMKAIELAFDNVDQQIALTTEQLDKKAPLDKPQFTGYVILPHVSDTTYPSNPIEGMVVYNIDQQKLMIYSQGKWASTSSEQTLSQYVKKSGDIMTGRLIGKDAQFVQRIKALPPDADQGQPTDIVATVQWTKAAAQTVVKQYLTGGSDQQGIIINNGDIIVNGGSVIANRLYGDIDMGVIQ